MSVSSSKPVPAKLRLAEPADLDLLQPLVRSYHAFENIPSSAAERTAALRRLLADPALGGIWLIYADGAPAGYIALCRGFSIEFNGFDAFVDEFYLIPELRGQGIGGEVLRAVKQQARQMDINALHLEVAADNRRARKLYAAAGFEAREKYRLMSARLDQQ